LAIFDQIGDTLRDQNQQQIPEDAPENA